MSHMSNPLVSPEQLYQRIALNALPIHLLDAIFFATQCLTQAAGLLLELPQSVTAQANVLLARYWAVEPVKTYEFSSVSAAAVYLVAKMGPSPRSPRDVVNVYAYLTSSASTLFRHSRSDRPNNDDDDDNQSSKQGFPLLSDAAYRFARTSMLELEARILYALGFDTHVALPHPLAVTYLQALDFLGLGSPDATSLTSLRAGKLARRALAYLNTALLSPQMFYLTHQPGSLATAAVYAAARDVGVRMPCGVEWWEVFDVGREELGFMVVGMRSTAGWARERMLVDIERMRKGDGGMLTREDVELEMARRGLSTGLNGPNGACSRADEEAEMKRKMDERMDMMEATGQV